MQEPIPNKFYKAGDVIFNAGDDPADGLFYICYGDVEITRDEAGQSRSLAKLTTGGVFGEMAIINAAKRNASVTALTDCACYTINQTQFQHHVNQLPPIMRGVFRCFALTIRDFLSQQEVWSEQMRAMHAQQAHLAVPAAHTAAQPDESGEASGLAGGQSRSMHY